VDYKRDAAAALIAVLALVGTQAHGATAPRSRSVPVTYTAPGGVQGQVAGHWFVDDQVLLGGFLVSSRRTDRRVALRLTDASGLAVPGEIAEDVNGDGTGDVRLGTFCSRTGAPIRLRHPGVQLVVYVYVGTCEGVPSAPTFGQGVVTFTR